MRNGKYLVAIIGCGSIAKHHASAVLHNNDIMELYAVCDILEDKAQGFAEKYNVNNVYADYIEMLKLKEIDIVCICTSSGLHAEHAIKCAEYGKNVLCEKPLDISVDAMNKMENAFKNTGLKICTVFQYRTYLGNVEAKRIIEKGELGKVLIGNGYCKIFRSQEYYNKAEWRGTWKYDGGGCLMNQAIHTLDVLSWFCEDVKSVLAKTYTIARNIVVEDTACVILSYKNGAHGMFFATTLANPDNGIEVEIICEKGTIVFDGTSTCLLTEDHERNIVRTDLGNKYHKKNNNSNDPVAIDDSGHKYLLKKLAEAIKNDTEVLIPIKVGRRAVDIILSIYQSSKLKSEIIVDQYVDQII